MPPRHSSPKLPDESHHRDDTLSRVPRSETQRDALLPPEAEQAAHRLMARLALRVLLKEWTEPTVQVRTEQKEDDDGQQG